MSITVEWLARVRPRWRLSDLAGANGGGEWLHAIRMVPGKVVKCGVRFGRHGPLHLAQKLMSSRSVETL